MKNEVKNIFIRFRKIFCGVKYKNGIIHYQLRFFRTNFGFVTFFRLKCWAAMPKNRRVISNKNLLDQGFQERTPSLQ